MSNRELVIQALTTRMIAAFARGDLIDAQNLEAFIEMLEGDTDEEFREVSADRDMSDIA